MSISPSAQLLRGFAVDFLTAHNVAAVETIMEPDYALSIGGFLLAGRDDSYLPATAAQLEQFPGLCVTVHDVVIGPDAVAMRFTEHGASIRHQGRLSTWGGVTLFRIKNGRLQKGWAEEDYFARKRQLSSGICDAVKATHPAPWDAPCEGPDAAVEALASAWITNPASWSDAARIDEISAEGPRFSDLVAIEAVAVNQLISAGKRGAFHISCTGSYTGGFEDIDPARIGQSVTLHLAGIFDVALGQVTRVQVTADRLGLHRSLMGFKS
jgi:SnoaL-like polyketide cyclase